MMRTSRKSANSTSAVPNPSPFRYPGGKSWLIPYVRKWVKSLPSVRTFAEPFAGGANVGLTIAMEQLARRVVLVELDEDVASVWECVLNGHADALAKRISDFRMSKKAVKNLLARKHRSSLSQAFCTIVKNRARRGGILTDNASLLRRGENGKGVRSRWYPETLKTRIEKISATRERIAFYRGDGLDFIRANARAKRVAFFIDPPYPIAGRRLYKHSTIDHEKLFERASAVEGAVLMTYDDNGEIRALARQFGFRIREVQMRTTHHSVKTELLISRDFSWLRGAQL